MIDVEQLVLAMLRHCADRGLRCPTNREIIRYVRQATDGQQGVNEDCFPAALAFRGFCRVEVYGRNYRVVEIDRRRTADAPAGREPYLIITKGKRDQRFSASRRQRERPSLPPLERRA